MGVTKKNIALSSHHVQLMEKTEKALKKVSAALIAETKRAGQLYDYFRPAGQHQKNTSERFIVGVVLNG